MELPDLPDAAKKPTLMAIGDSIFNGFRAMSIKQELPSGSPPSRVAHALGLSTFIEPDYPDRPVLIDAEEVARNLAFGRIAKRVVGNATKWLAADRKWSTQPWFDNIGVGGYRYDDLWSLSADQAYRTFEEDFAAFQDGGGLDRLASMIVNLNAAFLLNPSGDENLGGMTAIKWLAARQPDYVAINIGSNDGLFALAFNADIGTSSQETRLSNRQMIERIPGLAERLAKELAEACPGARRFFFNLLIRPRTLANLAPLVDTDMDAQPGSGHVGDGYYDRYYSRILGGSISGDQMREVDKLVADVNRETRERMLNVLGARIRFVDLYAKSDALDVKHYGFDRAVWVRRKRKKVPLTNRPKGGVFSLDNMHPSFVGYAFLAQWMLDEIVEAEPRLARGAVRKIDVQAAYDQDSFLQDRPAEDVLELLASLLRTMSFGGR